MWGRHAQWHAGDETANRGLAHISKALSTIRARVPARLRRALRHRPANRGHATLPLATPVFVVRNDGAVGHHRATWMKRPNAAATGRQRTDLTRVSAAREIAVASYCNAARVTTTWVNSVCRRSPNRRSIQAVVARVGASVSCGERTIQKTVPGR